MILDCYYRFEKNLTCKAKNRYELIANVNEHDSILKPNKEGQCWIYFTQSYAIKHSKRKPDMSLSDRQGNHISGIYIPDIDNPDFAHGNIKGTQDALLLMIRGNSIDLFIAKGKRQNELNLYQLLSDGELEPEIKELREKAIFWKKS